jgi:hypothetical protein
MSETCLNQTDLARRWRISPRTLERWRWLREGPRYLKLGGRVLYRVSDIEAYERSMIRLAQADSLHAHSFPNNHGRAGQASETFSISGRLG